MKLTWEVCSSDPMATDRLHQCLRSLAFSVRVYTQTGFFRIAVAIMDDMMSGRPHSTSEDVYDWLLDSETGSRTSFDVTGDHLDASDIDFDSGNIAQVPVAKVLRGPFPISQNNFGKTRGNINSKKNSTDSRISKSSDGDTNHQSAKATGASLNKNTKKSGISKSNGNKGIKNKSSGSADSGRNNGASSTSDKVLSRLEKNRQSARDCRRRKKERVKDLEERVKRLERQIVNCGCSLKLDVRVKRLMLQKMANYKSNT